MASTTNNFDYSASDTDDDTVRKIAAEMSGSGLKPLSDEEKQLRQLRREENAQRWAEQSAEREYQQNLADEAERQQKADEIAERNRQTREQMRLEYQQRAAERSRSLDLSILRNEAQQASAWRSAVQRDLRQQYASSLYGELEKMLSPPPEPENLTEVVYVSEDEGSPDFGPDFNPALFNKKPRSWW